MISSVTRMTTMRLLIPVLIWGSIAVHEVSTRAFQPVHSIVRRQIHEKKITRESHPRNADIRRYNKRQGSSQDSYMPCPGGNVSGSDDFIIGSRISSSVSRKKYTKSSDYSSSSNISKTSSSKSESSFDSNDSTSSSEVNSTTDVQNSSSSQTSTSSESYDTTEISNKSSTYENSQNSVSNALASSFAANAMKQNGLYLGFLPDDGSSGGSRETMAQLNAAVGAKSSSYGWYSQVVSGKPYDGSQLLAVIDDVKACNCVFQPAVMPTGGWQGLTSDDNSQAVAIAKVMKQFTDEGIIVWLRFAHEVNYYQTDGTYQGNADDFKKGWAAVSAAVKSICPKVKMWWTPNVAPAENYAQYEPYDLSTVDLVGIDFYPKSLSGSDFIDTMQAFHDKYAVDGRMFAIGETGLGYDGSIDDKFKWLAQVAAARSSMPKFVAMSWFNFQKGYNYKVAGENSLNQKFTSFIAS